MATYPSSIVSFATHNSGDTIQPGDINTPNAEIIAVETGLLNGVAHTVKPLSDNTYDLGTTTLQFRDLYVKRNLIGLQFSGVCQGRLTLTTVVPVTTADVTAATTIYYTPYLGKNISLYDGTNWTLYNTAEISIAVPATTSTMYDVFCYANAGVPTLELLAWTNDTTRATALVMQDGILCKTGALTRRFLGSFRTTGVSGQTEDSVLKRYVSNFYNRVPRELRVVEATASWTYTTAVLRQANGAAGNQVDIVNAFDTTLDLFITGYPSNGVAGVIICNAIGEDSTTTMAADQVGGTMVSVASANIPLVGRLVRNPPVGRHFYAWLEGSVASNTTTFWSRISTGITGMTANAGLKGWIFG